MRSFIKVFGVLFLFLIQLTSCLNDDNSKTPFYYFYDEPVVVTQTGAFPSVRNESYMFNVPGLAGDTVLKAGNLLWSSFIVELGARGDVDYLANSVYQYTAESFRYERVDSANVTIPESAEAFKSYLSDDYSAVIALSVLYNYRIDSLWFFGFRQQDRSNYTYELVLNPEIESGSSNIPTLYIRAKKISDTSNKAYSRDGNAIFAFDAADFVKYYRETISNNGRVRFNLKYKTGVDANGNDIYRPFMSNPLSWDF